MTMTEKTYCPVCRGELEMLSGCGAVGYFCNHCRKLVSRSKMLTKENLLKAHQDGSGRPRDESETPRDKSETPRDFDKKY